MHIAYILWTFAGACLLWHIAFRSPKIQWILLFLWLIWLFITTLGALSLFWPQWFDSREERQHIRSIEQALFDKKTTLSLEETTPFRWTSVCIFNTALYERMSDTDKHELSQNLGQHHFWKIDVLSQNDPEQVWLVFATPEGPLIVEPRWWRFNIFNTPAFYGKNHPFSGHSYDVRVKTDNANQLCHERGEVRLSFIYD